RARNQDVRRHLQRHRPELADARHVGDRLAREASPQQRLVAFRLRHAEMVLGPGVQEAARLPEHQAHEQLRLEARAVAGAAQNRRTVLEVLPDGQVVVFVNHSRSGALGGACRIPAACRVRDSFAPVHGRGGAMKIYRNVLEMVGRTPLLEMTRMDTGRCRQLLKLELMNPGGSIKDRIGISMIEEAEKRGDIEPGDLLVEATAGNTGIGLALAAAQKGYRLLLVLPDKMSQEKIFNLRAMGAEIVLTRS